MSILSDISFEELEAEYMRRKAERIAERKRKRMEVACCRNCAYRMIGKTNYGMPVESAVCEARPKMLPAKLEKTAPYMRVYYACNPAYKDCPFFLSKYGEEGAGVVRRRRAMADRAEAE